MPSHGSCSARFLLISTTSLLVATPAFAGASEVEIEVEGTTSPPAAPAPTEPPPPPAATAAEAAALRAQVEALQARLGALEAAAVEAAKPPPPPPARPWVEDFDLHFSGYIQPQLFFSQLSQDALSADGHPLNQDRFSVRRGRLEVEGFWKYAYASLEVDMNTVDGPRMNLAGAELAGMYPGKEGAPPLVRLGAGLSNMPFGYEIVDEASTREFMERSLGSRALFPGDSDVGFKLSGGLGPLRYALGVVNGVPVTLDGDPVVYTEKKTLLGRVGVDTGKEDRFVIRGGASFLKGTGFHEGTTTTKSQLQWTDVNQDGTVTLNELTGVTGQASTESESFEQWAVNADIGVRLKSPLGWTHVYGEATIAANLDRGYYVADPVSTGYDLRELAWYVAATQEVTRYGMIGFRADSYQPASDLFEARRGLYLPADASVLTLSPLLGVRWPGLAKLYVQYDYVVDFLGRDSRGEPIDLPNDQWTVRGQVEF